MTGIRARAVRRFAAALCLAGILGGAAALPGADAPGFSRYLLRRMDFGTGDAAGGALAGAKPKTRSVRTLEDGNRVMSVNPAGGSDLVYFLGFIPEDGKSYVFRLRMKTGGGQFFFNIDQKGPKAGTTAYFRVERPDIFRTIAGKTDWQAHSWEFRPVPSAETGCPTTCLIYATVVCPEGAETLIDDIELWEKPAFYAAGFDEQGGGAASGWSPSGEGAGVDGGAGSPVRGSLKIGANARTKKSPVWESPLIPVPDRDIFLSCRIRDRLVFSPDPTYNVNVGMVCLDGDRKPIADTPEAVSVWDGYVPDFGSALVSVSPETWHYMTRKASLPAATRFLRLRFGFRHSYQADTATTGEAWLDDVQLSFGAPFARDNAQGDWRREHAWPVWENRNLRIHTAAYMNLFLPADERMAFDVVVLDGRGAMEDQSDVALEYRVEDFHHAVVAEERRRNPGFVPVPPERLAAARTDPRLYAAPYWRQVALPRSLSVEAGRWFKLTCRVLKAGRVVAEGNTDLGVLRPAAPVPEAARDASRFAAATPLFSPEWGRVPPAAGLAPRPRTYAELFGFHWMRAGYINGWAAVQPERDGPMDWERSEVEALFRSGLLARGTNNRAYLFFNSVLPQCRPAWANVPGMPVGADSLDPEAFARFVGAVVGRYKGCGIMWMPGFSETKVDERQAFLGRIGYEAAKKADPDAVVFCNGLTGISVERMKQYFDLGHLDFTDALDLHFYYDPYQTEETLDYVQAEMRRRNRVKPVWSAEIGSFCPDSEILCKDMVKKHVIAFACGMRNVSWHSLSSPETRKINPMWEFFYRFREGRLSSACPPDAPVPGSYDVPLPRLFTLNNLLRDLDYVVPRERAHREDGVRVYVFDREAPRAGGTKKETVIALWRHRAGKADEGKSVALNASGPVAVRDAFGLGHTLVPDASGRVFLPASDNPLIVNAGGGTAVAFADGPFDIRAPEKAPDAGSFAVDVSVAARGGRPVRGTLRVAAGLGWRSEPAAAAVDLAGDATRTVRFTLTPPAEPAAGKHRVRLLFTARDGALHGYDECYVRVGP